MMFSTVMNSLPVGMFSSRPLFSALFLLLSFFKEQAQALSAYCHYIFVQLSLPLKLKCFRKQKFPCDDQFRIDDIIIGSVI